MRLMGRAPNAVCNSLDLQMDKFVKISSLKVKDRILTLIWLCVCRARLQGGT